MSSVFRSAAQVLTTTWVAHDSNPLLHEMSQIESAATNNDGERVGNLFIFPTEAACAQTVYDLENTGISGGEDQPFLDLGKTIRFTVKGGNANSFTYRLFKLGRGNSLVKYCLVSKVSTPAMETVLDGYGNLKLSRGN